MVGPLGRIESGSVLEEVALDGAVCGAGDGKEGGVKAARNLQIRVCFCSL